jgi:hypothetical protein
MVTNEMIEASENVSHGARSLRGTTRTPCLVATWVEAIPIDFSSSGDGSKPSSTP